MSVTPTHAAQLGLLCLGVLDTSPFSTDWTHIHPSILDLQVFRESDRPLISALRQALTDPGLGFYGEHRYVNNELIIRCCIVPSDAIGSTWKRTHVKSSFRSRYLGKIFHALRAGWDGENGEGVLALGPEDSMRMSDLYAHIPSPPEPTCSTTDNAYDTELQQRLCRYEEPEGLITSLYRYQFRSVAKMLQMETQPGRLVDPRWTKMSEKGREGVYYVNLESWDIQRHPGWYDLPRGGILNEQMGVGKTLMALTLILSTLHQPCLPPPHAIDVSHITTTHRERSYPFEADSHLRGLTDLHPNRINTCRPTLADLCLDIVAITHPSARRSSDLPQHLIEHLQDRLPLYYEFPPDDSCMREAKRRVIRRETRRIYLANTTLVICPVILVEQWMHEVKKHMEDGALRVFKLATVVTPSIETLISYDAIIMSVERFATEESMSRKEGGQPSVFMEARWKRIILDEGHIAGSKTSDAVRLAQKLSVERRWAVSGTPTKNLQQGGETELGLLDGRVRNGQQTSRAWSAKDIDDATRLGVIIGGFLAAEPFKSDAAFQESVTSHLSRKDGPDFGAVQRIRYLMSSLMVKHAPHVIDAEALLPPSTRSTEILQFHPMQRLTYNVLAALVASNVYTSAFEDVDYFLHPRNVNAYNQVIKNLHLACFWYSATSMGTADCLRRIQDHLENNDDITSEGRQQLEEAVQHLRRALDTPGWNEWMTNGISAAFEGTDLPLNIRVAWSDSYRSDSDVVDTASLNALRDLNQRGMTEGELLAEGQLARDAKRRLIRAEDLKDRSKPTAGKRKAHDDNDHETVTAAKQPTILRKSPKKKAEKRRTKDEMELRLEQAARNAEEAAVNRDSNGPRPLPDIIQTVSRSSKLNFVIRAIQEADPTDKFVIFGDSFELGHLTEALDLFDIESRFVGYGASGQSRKAALQQFEEPDIRVCLLDLRLAARGLNLVVANRMLFLSPVWNLDVLAQAVKRVHRIGQTRPTTIQILAIEGTFEEDIANRAANMRTDTEEKLYSRAMIENPRFVYPERIPTERFIVNLVPIKERDEPKTPPLSAVHDAPSPRSPPLITPGSNTTSGAGMAWPIIGTEELAKPGTKRPKKRARVAFV